MQLDAFQVLADPTRRRIVGVLRAGEQQVNDVVEKAGIHQSGVSRHLRILAESGFVSMRPDGQRRLYALRPEPFRELDAWLGPYRELWEARLDRFGAALEKRRSDARTAAAPPASPGPRRPAARSGPPTAKSTISTTAPESPKSPKRSKVR